MNKTLLMGLVITAMAVTAISTVIPKSFAVPPESKQNGWGEVTSESARSSGGLGEHTRANGGFPDSEPPFNSDGDPGREGLGNVAGGGQNIQDLGCTLASIDNNPATGC